MIKMSQATEKDIYEAAANAKLVFRHEKDLVTNAICDLSRGPAVACRNPDGSLACVVGGVCIWDGVARIWAITTPNMDLYPVRYARLFVWLHKWFVGSYNVHRVEFTVRSDFEKGCRLAEFLGFKKEGVLAAYGPDMSDYCIYGKVS